MTPLTITYRFKLPDGSGETFTLKLNPESGELVSERPALVPDWTKLGFHQCPHCPLRPESVPFCPVALNLVTIVNRFDGFLSYETLQVQVETPERTISGETTVQRGISSLLGLVMATSGCPRAEFFVPMARFHLPLATREETIIRAASNYLLGQYFRHKAGEEVNGTLDGLAKIYEDMQVVNACTVERLRSTTASDSTVNAVLVLDIYAKTLEFALDESLAKVRHLFLR